MSTLPVYVEEVEDLTTGTAVLRSKQFDTQRHQNIGERRIHGCLIVGRSGAAILVEMNDGEAQKRFTIAHECSHFILEVKRHQERAACKLGHDFTDVLHGLREATPSERIDAWLHNIRADAFVHFMDRTPSGEYGCVRIRDAETQALNALAARRQQVMSLLVSDAHYRPRSSNHLESQDVLTCESVPQLDAQNAKLNQLSK